VVRSSRIKPEEDIDGTEAHDIMLHEQGIISREELKKILAASRSFDLKSRKERVRIRSSLEIEVNCRLPACINGFIF
jgi:argininosuccinate lyase